jgi:hypothetical protein
MRALVSLTLLLPLTACSYGLSALNDGTAADTGLVDVEDDGPADTNADDGAPEPDAVQDNLSGRVYSLAAADMTVVEPPGLDALFGEVLTRDLLVYVANADARSLTLDIALAATDGGQDACEAVRQFPAADWTDNPSFVAGPGQLDTTFGGGHPASFRKLLLAATFAPDGSGWSDGTLDAVLDTRELSPALPELGDLCEFVSRLGGECSNCDDGEPYCFVLSVEGVDAREVDVPFDPTPAASSCP